MVLERRDAPLCSVHDEALFMKLIRGAFVMRRKTLVNNLMSAFPLSREEASACIDRAGLPAQVRAEALSIEELARLCNEISGLQASTDRI